jgi:chemotaxis response regulator CheB
MSNMTRLVFGADVISNPQLSTPGTNAVAVSLLVDGTSPSSVSPRTGRNKQVDLFLTSLAEAMGARAIGIILSGYDGDGTDGCKHIKAKGGTTFAQDMSAEVDGMPRSAQASGCVDHVLPPDKIPDELQRLIGTSMSKRA